MDWRRSQPHRIVLPAWSFDEITQAREHIFTGDLYDNYEHRFHTFGGVPRYVFVPSYVTMARSREMFEMWLPSGRDLVAFMKMVDSVDLLESTIDKGALLLTHEVDDQLQVTKVKWVSDETAQWAMESLMWHFDHQQILLSDPSCSRDFNFSAAYERAKRSRRQDQLRLHALQGHDSKEDEAQGLNQLAQA